MRQACETDVAMQSFRVFLAAEMMTIMIMVLAQSLDIALHRRNIRAYSIRFKNLLINRILMCLLED